MIGRTLHHYRVTEKLGAGGMGVVYRAADEKLGRDVAIKVLPAAFAESAERRSRFEREAQLLASLNHPNIAAIHGLEEFEGVHYLVLELVPGETLGEGLASGPLPEGEALELARQIADGLDAAHERGVIHRDLKPANVKINPEGDVKILDFGLAKAFVDEPSQEGLSNSPTLSAAATRDGVILGTAPYMSPEQARGKAVDKRTDVFSFGAVLYEMLTGRRAFDGDEVSDILASVLKSEPDWDRLPPGMDRRLRILLERCLEKDRRKRRRDMGDVAYDLAEMMAAPKDVAEKAPRLAAPGRRAFLLALVVGALATLVTWSFRPEPPPRPVMRFAVSLPLDDRRPLAEIDVALSPDGTHVAYSAGRSPIYVRALSETTTAPLDAARRPMSPFFSPDGEWLAFWSDGKLQKVRLGGGDPVTLCEVGAGLNRQLGGLYGGSWGTDGAIVFGDKHHGIRRVSENGGTPETLVALDPARGEIAYGPQILPGGRAVLFSVGRGAPVPVWNDARIVVASLDTGEQKVVLEGGYGARFLPSGHLVYVRSGSLMGAPFDPERLALVGDPVPMLEDLDRPGYRTPGSSFDVSRTGSLLYARPRPRQHLRLVWVDRKGNVTPLEEKSGHYRTPRLSPDNGRLALTIVDEKGRSDIWFYDLDRASFSRLTNDGENLFPRWSPDGEWLAFASYRDGDWDLYRKRADLSGAAERILEREHMQTPQWWSSNGKHLLFAERTPSDDGDIWVLDVDKDEPRLLARTDRREYLATLSPDGRFFAYHTGGVGVLVQPFDEPGGQLQIGLGWGATWSPNGRELFYFSADSTQLSVVDIVTEPELSAGRPRVFFDGPFVHGSFRNYDITADGERVVMLMRDEDAPVGQTAELSIVLNWVEELEARVPTNR